MTKEALLEVARAAYQGHPDLGSDEADGTLLRFLLERIEVAYDPSRPVESAKEALQHVALALFVLLNALYTL